MRAGMALANGNNEKNVGEWCVSPLEANAPIDQETLSLVKGAI